MNYIKTIRQKIGHDCLLVAGAGVIAHQNGRILLQKRRDNGCWAMHGGCVELGESIEEAARRELFEETGLTAGELTLFGVYSGEDMFYTYPNGDKVYVISIVYACTELAGEPIEETNETLALQWFDADKLPDNLHPGDRRALTDFTAARK